MQLVKISWHRLACEHTPSVQWIGRRPSAAYGATAKSGPPDLEHVCVQAKFVNGKPDRIEAKYVMRIELVDRLDKISGGKGGFWEDRGYEWYAGI